MQLVYITGRIPTGRQTLFKPRVRFAGNSNLQRAIEIIIEFLTKAGRTVRCEITREGKGSSRLNAQGAGLGGSESQTTNTVGRMASVVSVTQIFRIQFQDGPSERLAGVSHFREEV